MSGFSGREGQLAALYRLLAEVSGDPGSTPGQAVLVRGPRRSGKSRLVEEFLARAVVPYRYFSSADPLTGPALRSFAEGLSAAEAGVVVIDDLPDADGSDPTIGAIDQRAPDQFDLIDRELAGRRMLLIGIGSERARLPVRPGPAFGRTATRLSVPVLSPSELATRLALPPAEAFEAFLVTGGLPLVVDGWPAGASRRDYLDEALASPTSALLVSAERLLAAEFPAQLQARQVLAAIGSGERTFAGIRRAAGSPPPGSLSRALATLRERGLIRAELPLSTARSAETRYRVADPYLRFWLAFVGPHQAEIERGRGDLSLARIERAWAAWCRRAIEPVLREALSRLLTRTLRAPAGPDAAWSAGEGESGPLEPRPVVEVGGYWTRSNRPEIDIVLADRAPIAGTVLGVGAIEWLRDSIFDDEGYHRLLTHRSQLPGAERQTPVFAVCRCGSVVPGVRSYTPSELLPAW